MDCLTRRNGGVGNNSPICHSPLQPRFFKTQSSAQHLSSASPVPTLDPRNPKLWGWGLAVGF